MFRDGDELFHTAEQYIMYRKAVLFGDLVTAQRVLAARTPGECKRLGRVVRPYDDAVWCAVRLNVAVDACRLKFSQHKKCRAALLATGERLLVEASPSDRVWGIGIAEQDALAYRHQWDQNLLGQALMQVRATLRQETNG
ncbi:NADAR family protein [Deinococcus sonorensis]|uniref:NADAR family protein n=1 Tax=Deinococcus sonorensis KR-87 TaxID=694439 RepID=A0AAU7U6Q2_9DEIO